MKKIILLALAALLMAGCGGEQEKQGVIEMYDAPVSKSIYSSGYVTVLIDSCEYIKAGYRLAHKGNCRFCKLRRERELKELVEQLKKE